MNMKEKKQKYACPCQEKVKKQFFFFKNSCFLQNNKKNFEKKFIFMKKKGEPFEKKQKNE